MSSLTPRWFPLKPHQVQSRLWRSQARFKAVAAGRGSGKTEILKRYLVRSLPVRKPWSDPRYAYLGPTRPQAKRIAWQDLKDLTPKHWIKEINETELFIKTIWNSELHVIGMDRPQRFEGDQWDGSGIDESCDQKPKSYDLSVRPALTHRTGWCWRIGVPKRTGVGAREFKQFYDRGLRLERNTESFHWKSSDILPPEEILELKESLSPTDYAEQAEASWEQAGGLAFSSFSLENIVHRAYDPTRRLIVGSDFNVNPMAWVIAQDTDDGLHVIDELYLRNTHTRESLDVLWSRFGERHKSSWHFIGDAAARARKTSADTTDYLLIANDQRFKATTAYPLANPSVRGRLAATNALLLNTLGQRRCFVNPSCTHLIDDLSTRSLLNDGSPEDKHEDSGHITDALGYVIAKMHPITYIQTEDDSVMSVSMG